MESYSFHEIADSGKIWTEFVRTTHLSAGVYRLAAGSTDHQKPHGQDELYFVVRGRCRFVGAGREVSVEPGTILFVPAREEHRFADITEDLELLVCFGPAEGCP